MESPGPFWCESVPVHRAFTPEEHARLTPKVRGYLWKLKCRGVIVLAAAAAVVLLVSVPAAGAASSTSYSGTTSDGGSWVADVPSPWNGTLLLYSHGYGSTQPADAPDQNTQQALLNRGYALAGSSYDPNGSLWQLGSAVRDQFLTLSAVERRYLPRKPKDVIAVGTSMGGLISSLEAERAHNRIDGALTTCGIVAGGLRLGNYQLDGEYAIDKLLAAGAVKLVRFANIAEAANSATLLQGAATAAQATSEARG